MSEEILNSKYIYFLGKDGIERGYQRRGCQWFNEAGKRWQKCCPEGNVYDDVLRQYNYGTFLPDTKYRRLKPPGSTAKPDHQ